LAGAVDDLLVVACPEVFSEVCGEAFSESEAVFSAASACFSEVLSEVLAGDDCEDVGALDDCRGNARAIEGAPLRSPQNAASASAHHHLRPNRTTFLFFARRREHQNLPHPTRA